MRAIVAIAMLALLPTAALAQLFDRETEDGDALILEVRTGASIELEQHDEARLVIEASGWGRNSNAIELTKTAESSLDEGIPWQFVSGSVWLLVSETENPKRGNGLHLSVTVPAGMAIGIRSAGGALTADRLSGSLEGSIGAGPIELRNLRGAHIDLSTGAGEIRLSHSAASGLLKTRAGNIFLEDVEGEIIALAPVGSVHRQRVRRGPEHAMTTTRPIELERRSGHLQLDRVPAGGRLRTDSGNVDIIEAHGPLVIYSGAGHVRVGRLHGAGDITARAGELVVGLARPSHTTPIEIRLRSDAGGLTLFLPRGMGFNITGQILWNSRRPRPALDAPFHLETTDGAWRKPRRPGLPRVDRALTVKSRSGNEQLVIDFEIAGNLKIELVDPVPTPKLDQE